VDGVPVELTDPDHPLWHDLAAFAAYMQERGWPMPAADRYGPGGHPDNRRRSAVYGWAVEAGITTTFGASMVPLADGPRLAGMGLIEPLPNG
jgi:hypothetical protein